MDNRTIEEQKQALKDLREKLLAIKKQEEEGGDQGQSQAAMNALRASLMKEKRMPDSDTGTQEKDVKKEVYLSHSEEETNEMNDDKGMQLTLSRRR